MEVQCQGFAVGLSVPARIASLTPGDPCWTVIFFLSGAKPQKTNNANRTNKPTKTTTTNASRAALGLKTASLKTGRRPWTSWYSASSCQDCPAYAGEPLPNRLKHPKPSRTTTNNNHNKPNPEPRPNKPNPKPRQTKPKQRTNTPHSPQIAEALYAGGASLGSAMPRIRR